MLESLPVSVILGSILGFLSGLGVGGGSLLILWLTLALGMEQNTAKVVNLLFFLPAAGISCWFRWQQGTLQFKKMMGAILAGCAGALLGTGIGQHLDVASLKKGFGVLLIFTGIKELLWKQKQHDNK